MCIIIAAPFSEDKDIIPDDIIEKCANANSHGMGIAYVLNGKFTVYKSLKSLGRLMRKYKKAHSEGAAVLMHFRIATHGSISAANCHPFKVTDDLAFAHNGSIRMPGLFRNFQNSCGDEVDTVKFGREILAPIAKRYPKFLQNELICKMISNYIGGSKLAFIDREGKLYIINQARGVNHFDTGAWFSNSGFRPSNFTPAASVSACNTARRGKNTKDSTSREGKQCLSLTEEAVIDAARIEREARQHGLRQSIFANVKTYH